MGKYKKIVFHAIIRYAFFPKIVFFSNYKILFSFGKFVLFGKRKTFFQESIRNLFFKHEKLVFFCVNIRNFWSGPGEWVRIPVFVRI